MSFAYVILAAVAVHTVYAVWKAITTKKYATLIPLLLSIPIFVFFVVSVFLGGSAFHNAETDYELYEAGHYYLCSHGRYTEVTYGSYLCVKVLEIVGDISFEIGCIVSWRNALRGKDWGGHADGKRDDGLGIKSNWGLSGCWVSS
ncbi:MAG: hypothetical protein J6M42_10580 [Clostridia bacterium]|nr:hypothetical protein [Clostridia bacterium]